MPLRETRRFKTKGLAISFGNFILPSVGVVAIGLLLVAGKNFFFSDFQANTQPIPVSIAPPDTPRLPVKSDTPRADAGESINASSPQTVQTPLQRTATGGNLILDLGQDNKNHGDADSATTNLKRNGESQGNAGTGEEDIREEIIITPTQTPRPASVPAQTPPAQPRATPQPEPQPKTSQQPVESRPVDPKPVQQPEKTVTQPVRADWMVQIGAFSTRAAAESVLQRVTQEGHSATVLSGNTLHRVLVQAGPAKQDALNLATRLGQAGYPGAFVVPPRP